MTDKQLAQLIADRLFTPGEGPEALRLKLMSPDGRDMGGWCKQAVVDQIVAALRERVK